MQKFNNNKTSLVFNFEAKLSKLGYFLLLPRTQMKHYLCFEKHGEKVAKDFRRYNIHLVIEISRWNLELSQLSQIFKHSKYFWSQSHIKLLLNNRKLYLVRLCSDYQKATWIEPLQIQPFIRRLRSKICPHMLLFN